MTLLEGSFSSKISVHHKIQKCAYYMLTLIEVDKMVKYQPFQKEKWNKSMTVYIEAPWATSSQYLAMCSLHIVIVVYSYHTLTCSIDCS